MKIKNPTTLSEYFKINPRKLDQLHVFDPTLAIDTKLFIDPLLFPISIHPEIRTTAVRQYKNHFEQVIQFLRYIKQTNDVAWRTARRLLQFHEIKGTCLGYGTASIHGSGFGSELTERILTVGKEIVELGVSDPDLFPAMALFEANIGPDRISDMATNVAWHALVAFNERITHKLQLKTEEFSLLGTQGHFLLNPFQEHRTPIILVPSDILRDLPIAMDWDDVSTAASKNDDIRRRVNEHIGHIWAAKTKREKETLKDESLSNKISFQTLLDAIHDVPSRAYNIDTDPEGLIKWTRLGKEFTNSFPINLTAHRHPSNLNDLTSLVTEIIKQFQQLIEHNGLNKELYKENLNPRHESTAQRLFFAIAHGYCKANNVDVSPEVDSGNGKVDFKLSVGFEAKVLVEIKLSPNPKTVHGLESQLETYKKSELTMRAFYVVINVGHLGDKVKKLLEIQQKAKAKGHPLSELIIIDGTLKASASKRKK